MNSWFESIARKRKSHADKQPLLQTSTKTRPKHKVYFGKEVQFYWLPSIFAVRGRAFPALPLLMYLTYCAAIVALETYVFMPKQREYAKSVSNVQAAIGGLLAFLMSFRLNQAYGRWWDGRKCWESVRDGCINLTRLMSAYGQDMDKAKKFVAYISVFPWVLRSQLYKAKELTLSGELTDDEEQAVANANNMPVYVLGKMSKLLKEGAIESSKTNIFERQIEALNSACTKSNTVKDTTVPFAYVALLRTLAAMFLCMTPVVWTPLYGWYTLLACFLVAFPWFSVETVSIEIEAPFGQDYNDLPLKDYNEDIWHIISMYHELAPRRSAVQHAWNIEEVHAKLHVHDSGLIAVRIDPNLLQDDIDDDDGDASSP